MLRIRKQALEDIHNHMRETYPHECCGLLVGSSEGPIRQAEFARRCGNLNTERAADRYLLDPKDMLRVQQEFENSPLDIVGVYHSHPDHPSRPSQFDADHAWPGWSYVIGSVIQGRVEAVQSWELDDAEPRFEEEPIEIV